MGFRLRPRCDGSPGSCCAHPANTSPDVAYVTTPWRNIVHHARRSLGQQIQGRTGLGLSLINSMKWGCIQLALRAERKCEMRRFMVAVVAVVVVFAAGVSYAQESGPASMPEKVRDN